jgi:hypothetical protein
MSATSWPSSRMRPEVGVSKPASMRSSVDLPQPDEPSRAKISPLAMSRLTWLTALTAAEVLDDVLDLQEGGVAAGGPAMAERGSQPGLEGV